MLVRYGGVGRGFKGLVWRIKGSVWVKQHVEMRKGVCLIMI